MHYYHPQRFCSLILSVLIICFLSFSGIQEDLSSDPGKEEVDTLFFAWDKPDSPGCALGVIQDGCFIYRGGYGMANLEYGIPLSSQSVFRIASTSKQFTAMCIALLEEEGRLSVNDNLKTFFPEMPDYAKTISIRHLIHHTSGVRDYLTLMILAGARGDDHYSDPEVVDLIARQKELNFKPGDEFLYSNSGYFLLSQIVKRVTGESMSVYAEEKIFKPLGMKNSHFHDDHNRIVRNRASGYGRQEGGGFRINMTTLDMIGDGGVFTCVDDLLLWDQNFYDNKLGKGEQALINRVLTPGILNSGEKLDYAFGLVIGEYKGLQIISHGGSFVGFKSYIIRFPEQKFSVIVLANLGDINPSRLARQVADIFLADEFRIPEKKMVTAKKPEILKLPIEELKMKIGDFYDESGGNFIKITLRKERLFVNTRNRDFFIQPVSQDRFVSVDAFLDFEFEFEKPTENRPEVVYVKIGEEKIAYKKVRLETLDTEQLKAFEGDFYSEELGVTYQIRLKEDKLVLHHKKPHRPYPGGPLVPKLKEMFSLQGLLLHFDRDKKGKIISFSLDAGRVKNIRFVKR